VDEKLRPKSKADKGEEKPREKPATRGPSPEERRALTARGLTTVPATFEPVAEPKTTDPSRWSYAGRAEALGSWLINVAKMLYRPAVAGFDDAPYLRAIEAMGHAADRHRLDAAHAQFHPDAPPPTVLTWGSDRILRMKVLDAIDRAAVEERSYVERGRDEESAPLHFARAVCMGRYGVDLPRDAFRRAVDRMKGPGGRPRKSAKDATKWKALADFLRSIPACNPDGKPIDAATLARDWREWRRETRPKMTYADPSEHCRGLKCDAAIGRCSCSCLGCCSPLLTETPSTGTTAKTPGPTAPPRKS
jgi:hypothetical protein